ncbi:MAG: serine/threonine protein kinase [Catenulisporales bacterium]|nr:serine/threonine protein kinase [Catenulisporales bacterium]
MDGSMLDGRYRLQELLGRGGMGQVWRAFDERIGREVAVKIVTAATLTDDALARFDREARIAGKVSGPAIVTVHDYGHDAFRGETVPYLVMELVVGRTLAERVRADGPPPPAVVLDWGRQICEALTIAHAAAVIHRDIKPGNVMVTPAGAVKVLDFGIARFIEQQQTQADLTATGTIMGSAQYMSPEQAQGRHLDARSDLYSLGCLLFFALTGRAPFEADSPMGLAYQHVNTAPEPPSRYRPGIPPAVDALVLDLLAKEPEARPSDARAVGERIRAIAERDTGRRMPEQDTRPTGMRGYIGDTAALGEGRAQSGGRVPEHVFEAPAAGAGPEAPTFPLDGTAMMPPEPVRRSRRGFLTGTAAVAVSGAGVGTWLVLGHGSSAPNHPAAGPGATAGPGSSSGSSSPSPSPSPTPSPVPHDPTFVSELTAHTKPTAHVVFDPSGRILVSSSQDGTARLWDVSDPAHPRALGVCAQHTDTVWNLSLSPDGTTLATSSFDKTVGLWDIRDPNAPRLTSQVHLGSKAFGVAFSPDGETVAAGMESGAIHLIDVRRPTDPAGQWTLAGHPVVAYSVAFSPDGRFLASGSFDRTLRMWDVRDRAAAKPLGVGAGHTDRVFDIAFHPGGELVAAGSGDHSMILFGVSDPAHPVVVGRISEPDEATGVAFSADGRMAANGCGVSTQVRVYDISTPNAPKGFQPLTGHTKYTLGVAFSPDGRLLASASQDSTVRLWEF